MLPLFCIWKSYPQDTITHTCLFSAALTAPPEMYNASGTPCCRYSLFFEHLRRLARVRIQRRTPRGRRGTRRAASASPSHWPAAHGSSAASHGRSSPLSCGKSRRTSQRGLRRDISPPSQLTYVPRGLPLIFGSVIFKYTDNARILTLRSQDESLCPRKGAICAPPWTRPSTSIIFAAHTSAAAFPSAGSSRGSKRTQRVHVAMLHNLSAIPAPSSEGPRSHVKPREGELPLPADRRARYPVRHPHRARRRQIMSAPSTPWPATYGVPWSCASRYKR